MFPAALQYPVYAQAHIDLLSTSPAFSDVCLKGLRFSVDDPLDLEFIVDEGNAALGNTAFKEQSEKLVRYFLSALTLPAKDFWVNLSPYEQDRILPDELGLTDMGQELLGQDYLLKRLAASLT